jgi:hypothetical protein
MLLPQMCSVHTHILRYELYTLLNIRVYSEPNAQYVVLWVRMRTNTTQDIAVHACPRYGPWATCIRLSHAKAESEFPTL